MAKTLLPILDAQDPLTASALEALKLYYEAMAANRPEEEIERLRLEWESLWKAFSEYQLRMLGHHRQRFSDLITRPKWRVFREGSAPSR
ncbi:hypothetical protein D3C81_242200 [compost metagenome]|uniref:hypothetical protein n=1 Tax=unclassified Pseudomonas TaxID=196821 RepID=UPI000F9F8501|nr:MULTISPECIES: hypothetical protein [unclassified Pseudomonas]MDH0302260.1 hypothetical protein [Pseudomonas sp. GD04091]MDH1986009.1 hypothetical protein [Pseudomonas sp. GD03689]